MKLFDKMKKWWPEDWIMLSLLIAFVVIIVSITSILIYSAILANNADYARCMSIDGKFGDGRCFVNGEEMFEK